MSLEKMIATGEKAKKSTTREQKLRCKKGRLQAIAITWKDVVVFVLMATAMMAMRNLSTEDVLRVESYVNEDEDCVCSVDRVVSRAMKDHFLAGITEPIVLAGRTEPRSIVGARRTESR